jgi:hypothetical protein
LVLRRVSPIVETGVLILGSCVAFRELRQEEGRPYESNLSLPVNAP